MDRLTSMSVFVRIVDNGSFSAAAKRLDISPATVSSHVQTLEKRLGVQLLNRTTRTVSLTEAGSAFYERCTQILTEVEEAECMANALQSTPRGTLRLNTSVSLARLVTPVAADYAETYADVSFDVTMTDHMVDMMQEKYDLALRLEPLPDSSLITRRLGLGRLVLAAAPSYLARRGAPREPADLLRHNCLVCADSFVESHWRFDGPGGEEHIEAAGNLRTNSIEGLRAATLAGHGISLLPSMSVGEDLELGRLVRLLPEFRTNDAVIQAVYPPSRYLSAKVRTFLDFLAAQWSEGSSALSAERRRRLRIA